MKRSENQGPEKNAKETERHHRLSEQAQQLIQDDRSIEARRRGSTRRSAFG